MRILLTLAAAAAMATPVFAQNSNVTVLHGIPGLGGPVDVFANGNQLFSFDYLDQEGPLSLPPGPLNVEIRQNGNVLLGAPVIVPPGAEVSLIANLDASGTPVLSPFVNSTAGLTLPTARVNIRHTAEAPAVDIVISQNGSVVTTLAGVTNGQEASLDVAPGDYDVEILVAGTTTSAFGPATLSVENGVGYSVFAVGQALTPSFSLLIQEDQLASDVTVLHGIPGLGGPVDVFAGGAQLFSFDFGDQEGPIAVAPGPLNVEIRQNGNVLLGGTVQVPVGQNVSLIANLTDTGAPTLSPFVNATDNLTLPAARLNVRHTAEAPAVDVVISQNGSVVTTLAGVTNGQEASLDVAPGNYDVEILVAGTTTSAFGPATVALENGVSYSVFAVGQAFQPNFGLQVQRDVLTARVTVIHGIPGLPAPVDVFANGGQLFSFDFTDVQGPLVLNPGVYDLDVQLNGASVLGAAADLDAGDDVTVVAHLDAAGTTNVLSVFANDVSATVAGNARATVRHLAAAPAVNVLVDPTTGPLLASLNLSNGDDVTTEIPATFYDFTIEVASSGATVLGPVTRATAPQVSYQFYAVGNAGAGSFELVEVVRDLNPVVPGTLSSTIFGATCGPNISISNPSPRFGEHFTVDVANGSANGVAMLMFGNSDTQDGGLALPADLAPFGAPNCFLNTSILATRPVMLGANGQGSASVILPGQFFMPATMATPTLFLQYVTSTSTNQLGFLSSEGLRLRQN